MEKIKKIVTIMASVCIIASMAGCSGSANVNVDVNGGSNASSAADKKEDKVPEGYQRIEQTNEGLGIKVSFNVPAENEWESRSGNDDDIYYSRQSYSMPLNDENMNKLSLTVDISVASTRDRDQQVAQYGQVEDTDYPGFINGHSNPLDCPMYIYSKDEFYNGLARVYINPKAPDMVTQEDFDAMCADIRKSLKIEVLSENKLNTDDGAFLTMNGKFSYPAKVTIAGSEVETKHTTGMNMVYVSADFEANGKKLTIRHGFPEKQANYENLLKKENAYEFEVNGHPVAGRIYNGAGTLVGDYIVKYDDDTYFDITIMSEEGLDLAAIKEMLDGVNREGLTAEFNSYVTDFLSSAVKVG